MDDDVPEAVQEVADSIAAFVNGGDNLEGALRRLAKLGVPPQALADGRLHYERQVGRIRDLEDPRALVDTSLRLGHWYFGPKAGDIYWPALRSVLAGGDLPEAALGSVDASSNHVVGLLRPPGTPSIKTRGLVLGHVQSGKTTNFMSVIAKAADVGYRLFIVLSGITDNLRSQTQDRLEDSLVSRIEEHWYMLTPGDQDFWDPGNAANLLSRTDHRLLAVIKKNPYRLRRLVRWLDKAGPQVLASCPILLIDDEADQASIDVGTHGRTSRINGLIRQILDKPKAAYVAYTATPFANVLIDPTNFEDLYPRDFIVQLPKPDEYVGASQLFGRERLTPDEEESVGDGLDMIRHVDPEEVTKLVPPRGAGLEDWVPEVTDGLREAIRWFLLATASRKHRRSGNRHSTMLIHTSMLSAAHNRMRTPVEAYLRQMADGWRAKDRHLVEELEKQWQDETNRVPAESVGLEPVAWDELSSHLADVLNEVRVVIDNYTSTERLNYDKDGPDVTAIVIGGNTLSRGLTLEGLVCSLFVRAASAYDTLLQMGRWFGYRGGYEDLPRIWMTEELESWFFDLATVEEEVRREIARYQDLDLTPSDVPVRIRRHPAMAVTSAAKMRHAAPARVSFSQEREQTILFNHREAGWLRHNINATRGFLGTLVSEGFRLDHTVTGRPLFRDVPSEHVRNYFSQYQFQSNAYRLREDLLIGYLDEQTQQGYLQTWNVVVFGHPNLDNGEIDLHIGETVGLIERNRLDMPNISHANIKSLVSTIDRVADLNVDQGQITQALGRNPDDKRLATYREDIVGNVGLLGIYPISKDSKPRRPGQVGTGKKRRLPLKALDHVIGLGIFFPEARGAATEYTYIAADLSGIPHESDDTEILEMDAKDEDEGESAERPGPGSGVDGA